MTWWNMGGMRVFMAMFVLFAIGAVVSMAHAQSMGDDGLGVDVVPSGVSGVVEVGSMYPGIGSWWTAHEVRAASVFAQDRFNDYLGPEAGWSLQLVHNNTRGDPKLAMDALTAYDQRGINIILGPPTTVEMNAIWDYIHENKMLSISCCSSGISPLTSNDNVFRLVPDDTVTATVIAETLNADGKNAVVVLHHDNELARNYVQAVDVTHEGVISSVTYAGTTKAEVLATLEELAMALEDLTYEYPRGEVAVLFVGWEETYWFMVHAYNMEDAYLNGVKWYGANGNANDVNIIAVEDALAFADMVDFEATLFAAQPSHTTDMIDEHLLERGIAPTAFAYAAYDAVWTAGLAIQMANSTNTADVRAQLTNLTTVQDRFALDSAGIVFDENGDLLPVQFDQRGIEMNPQWTKITDNVSDLEGMIDIGFVYSLNTFGGAPGKETVVAAKYAQAKFNDYLTNKGITGWELGLSELNSDDGFTSTQSVVDLQKMIADDIKIFLATPEFCNVGGDCESEPKPDERTFYTSSIAGLLDVPPETGLIQLVMQSDISLFYCCFAGSTPPSLLPSPHYAIYTLSGVLEDEGVEAAVIMMRDSPFGVIGTETLVDGEYDGQIIRVPYPVSDLTPDVAGLAETVQQTINEYGIDNTAVVLIGFTEAGHILEAASEHDILGEIKWYGTSGAVNHFSYGYSQAALDFAESVNLKAALIGVVPSDASMTLDEYISDTLGRPPTLHSYVAHDVVWLVGLALEAAGTDDPTEFRRHLGAVGDREGLFVLNSQGVAFDKAGYLNHPIYDIVALTGNGLVKIHTIDER